MSDTPRTDALCATIEGVHGGYYEMLNFASALERELAACKGREDGKEMVIAQLERERDEWKHAFEVVNTKDHDALAADRAVERALGRIEGSSAPIAVCRGCYDAICAVHGEQEAYSVSIGGLCSFGDGEAKYLINAGAAPRCAFPKP